MDGWMDGWIKRFRISLWDIEIHHRRRVVRSLHYFIYRFLGKESCHDVPHSVLFYEEDEEKKKSTLMYYFTSSTENSKDCAGLGWSLLVRLYRSNEPRVCVNFVELLY